MVVSDGVALDHTGESGDSDDAMVSPSRRADKAMLKSQVVEYGGIWWNMETQCEEVDAFRPQAQCAVQVQRDIFCTSWRRRQLERGAPENVAVPSSAGCEGLESGDRPAVTSTRPRLSTCHVRSGVKCGLALSPTV